MGVPILVTGVPRSGTTWVARLLATAPATSLAGREPMNPRGRQFALGGTVSGWARMRDVSPAQHRVMRRAYRGWEPRVYSRYGRRQWAAPLPWSRLIVKDPFALLSLPAIVQRTAAVPVVVHRHPAAVLASYRRMGWSPDLDEVRAIAAAAGDEVTPVPEGPLDDATAMGVFWRALHELFLLDSFAPGGAPPPLVVVSHERLTGDESTCRALMARLGLEWSPATERELRHEAAPRPAEVAQRPTTLHDFDRTPQQLAEGWRTQVTPEEIDTTERITADVRARLDEVSLR